MFTSAPLEQREALRVGCNITHVPMIRKALQLLVFRLLFAVGVPLKTPISVTVDPCYAHCEGVKVWIRSSVRYSAVSVQACRHVGPGMNAIWIQSNMSVCVLCSLRVGFEDIVAL